jgi:hypothetical protein
MTNVTSPAIERKTTDFVLANPRTEGIDIEPGIEMNEKPFDTHSSYWLYALKLQNGKFYVGYTGRRNPYDRILQHGEENTNQSV